MSSLLSSFLLLASFLSWPWILTICIDVTGSSHPSEEAVQNPQRHNSERAIPRANVGSKQWRHPRSQSHQQSSIQCYHSLVIPCMHTCFLCTKMNWCEGIWIGHECMQACRHAPTKEPTNVYISSNERTNVYTKTLHTFYTYLAIISLQARYTADENRMGRWARVCNSVPNSTRRKLHLPVYNSRTGRHSMVACS